MHCTDTAMHCNDTTIFGPILWYTMLVAKRHESTGTRRRSYLGFALLSQSWKKIGTAHISRRRYTSVYCDTSGLCSTRSLHSESFLRPGIQSNISYRLSLRKHLQSSSTCKSAQASVAQTRILLDLLQLLHVQAKLRGTHKRNMLTNTCCAGMQMSQSFAYLVDGFVAGVLQTQVDHGVLQCAAHVELQGQVVHSLHAVTWNGKNWGMSIKAQLGISTGVRGKILIMRCLACVHSFYFVGIFLYSFISKWFTSRIGNII